MVVLEACSCGGLPAHSHLPTETFIHNGREITAPMGTAAMNGCEVIRTDPDAIRIWVDWKSVAHALMTADDESVARTEPSPERSR